VRRVRSTLVVIWHLLDRFVNEGCMGKAASLAYSNLLSLVPILIAGITIISWFPQLQNYGLKIQQFIVENFVADSANIIQNYLMTFVENIRYLSWVNIAMFMVVSVLMIYNISRSFNSIWHTHNPRPLWRSLIIYVVVLFAFPILLGIGFAITTYIVALPVYKNAVLEQIMSRQMLFVLSNVVNIVLFTVLNWVLPSVKVPFRAALIAGIVTDILFEIAKYGFSIYIYHVATYQLLYGALATIPVFLIWLYVSWLTILFGTLIGHFSVIGINRRWTPHQHDVDESVDFTPKKGFGE
jgi:membrane protein